MLQSRTNKEHLEICTFFVSDGIMGSAISRVADKLVAPTEGVSPSHRDWIL